MENYMYTSHHTDRKTSNSNLMALKAKLESLDKSFKSNLLSISDH